MERLLQVEEVFDNAAEGDELTIETRFNKKHNRKLQTDESPYVFGSYEFGMYITVDGLGVRVREQRPDGSLSASNREVTTAVNWTKNEWAGNNKDLTE